MKFRGTIVQTPYIESECISIYNQYCILVPRLDELIAHLKTKDVGCEVYYPVPAHLQECFKPMGYKQGDFLESEKGAKEILALPIYPEFTDEMKDNVVDFALSFYS